MTAPDENPEPSRVHLTESFHLPLPSVAAFPLFTARGERLWVEGWNPEFYTADPDTIIGTVFRTQTEHTTTIWIVIDSTRDEHIKYARVEDGGTAGTVDVVLHDNDNDNGCTVTVSYDLTATSQQSRGTAS